MFNKIFSACRSFLRPAVTKTPDDWRCYRLVDGKITPPYHCEVNAVDHCNISCLDCNHASPVANKRMSDPDIVFHDLSLLAKSYKAGLLKVIGGEPLLHPDLLSLILAIRKSGICNHIVLYTNGILLHQMNDNIWKELDEIELSVYPDTRDQLDKHMPAIKRTAQKHNVKLSGYFYGYFRATFSTMGTSDEELTRCIYRTCQLANEWGCQSIHDGHFFKCPQSIYIPKFLDDNFSYDYKNDGIRITGEASFSKKLKNYLSSSQPLKACRYCLASVGKLRTHTLVKAADWKYNHGIPTEKLIDYNKLYLLEKGIKFNSITTRETYIV